MKDMISSIPLPPRELQTDRVLDIYRHPTFSLLSKSSTLVWPCSVWSNHTTWGITRWNEPWRPLWPLWTCLSSSLSPWQQIRVVFKRTYKHNLNNGTGIQPWREGERGDLLEAGRERTAEGSGWVYAQPLYIHCRQTQHNPSQTRLRHFLWSTFTRNTITAMY